MYHLDSQHQLQKAETKPPSPFVEGTVDMTPGQLIRDCSSQWSDFLLDFKGRYEYILHSVSQSLCLLKRILPFRVMTCSTSYPALLTRSSISHNGRGKCNVI